MGEIFPGLGKVLQQLCVKPARDRDGGEGSVCCDDPIELAILAFSDEVFPSLRSWFNEFTELAESLPFSVCTAQVSMPELGVLDMRKRSLVNRSE